MYFVHQYLGFPIASTAVIAPLSMAFICAVERFAKEQQVDLVAFDKMQRKDELTHEYLAVASFTEEVSYIDKA